MRSSRGAIVISLSLTALSAQSTQPSSVPTTASESAPQALMFTRLANGLRMRCVSVPDSSQVCVLLAFTIGSDHDPKLHTGMAHVLEQFLRQSASAAKQPIFYEARNAATIAQVTCPREQLAEQLAELRRLLSGAVSVSEDAKALAIAATHKEIDELTRIYPGPILMHRARRALLAGTPNGRQGIGIAEEVVTLSAADLSQRLVQLYRPRNAILVLLGGGTQADLEKAANQAFADLETGPADVPAATVHDSAPPTEDVTRYEGAGPWRVDAPYLTYAQIAPAWGTPEYLPYLVAASLLQARVHRDLKMQGGEVQARFPLTHFSYWDGDRLLLLNRRGFNGAEIDSVHEDLQRVMAGVQSGIGADEIAGAARNVGAMLVLPPYDSELNRQLAAGPRMLFGKAFALAMAELYGWPADLGSLVGNVKTFQVQNALIGMIDPKRWRTFALLP